MSTVSQPRSHTILGIDPGYGRLGYAVIGGTSNAPSCHIFGCLETDAKQSVPERLRIIQQHCQQLIDEYHPRVLAIETLTARKNVSTVINVAGARGVVLVTAAAASLLVVEITPNQVKLALTGSGAANKSQVQRMVQRILKLPQPIVSDDAADALAVALAVQPQLRRLSVNR